MVNVYKEYKPPTSDGGLFHKFEDGKTYIVRIASDPVVYQSDFTATNGEVTTSTKYAWLAWNVEGQHPIILQVPVTAYKKIAAFASDDDYGDPKNYNLKITRTGTGLDTEYTVTPSPKQTPLAEVEGAENAKEEIAKLDLIELISKGQGVSHVNWLSDLIQGKQTKREITDAVNAAVAGDTGPTEDEVDEPFDLSKIPF